jgi:TM2 domain-containing membrane protein YozV
MAGLCAFLFPGLGHLILGKPGQAALWFVVITLGYLLLIVPGLLMHVLSIVDAAKTEREQKLEQLKAMHRMSQRIVVSRSSR